MIKIMLHDMVDDDRMLSYKESKKMIESYWEFCHGECCGTNVPYDQKEIWFCECHEEHHNDETVCDTVEWIWSWSFCGITMED